MRFSMPLWLKTKSLEMIAIVKIQKREDVS